MNISFNRALALGFLACAALAVLAITFHADPAFAQHLGGFAVAAAGGAAPRAHDDILEAFDQFSASVTERLSAMDDRMRPMDRFLSQTVPARSRDAGPTEGGRGASARDRYEAEISDRLASAGLIEASPNRAAMSASIVTAEHAAMATFIRSRGEDSEGLSALGDMVADIGGGGMFAANGMSVSSDPDGGWTVVPVLSNQIQQRTWDVSPLARLARREILTTGDAFEEPIDPSDIGAEWVGETEERPPLDTSKLKYLRVPVNEVYTNQPVTQRLLDDSRFNLGGWIEAKISDKFSRTEGHAYVHGDGVEKPLGFLNNDTSPLPDGERDWFVLQHINTGVGDGFPAATAEVSPADPLIDLVYSLRAPYRPNARWLMNLRTAGVVRKLKDSEGRFVWADAREGQPAMLLGFPVEFDEEMPDIGANATPIAFGDFQKGYIIVEKEGIRVLVDPYSSKPHVLFYAYRRVGGSVQNGEAIKLLRMAAGG